MKILIIVALFIFILTGCTTVTETIYLQDIEVSGPINHPPLHVTKGQKSGSVTISPRLSVNSTSALAGTLDGHTRINDRGFFQVDTILADNNTWTYRESDANRYDYNGENLQWNLPGASFGVDVDLSISDHVAIFGGINYVVQGQDDLFGGIAGIGFFSEKENGSIRIDAGIGWQDMAYDAATVVVTEVKPYGEPGRTYVDFYRDGDQSSSVNFFTSLTYNTAFKEMPFNFFINAGYFGQTLFDFEPSAADPLYYPFLFNTQVIDARGEATAGFFTISPGIYQDIGGLGRVMFGVRMLKETQLKNSEESFIVLPVVQIDFSL